MAAITTTDRLPIGDSRTFALAPGSALTLTLLPNCRVTVTETPETVSASDAGGNSPRTHNYQLAGVVTYGPYAMGGSVVVDNASNSGSSVAWTRKDTVVTTSSDGTSLVSVDGTEFPILTSNAGRVNFFAGTAVPAGGAQGVGVTMSSTADLGVFFGSGAPTLSAAQGSLYMRTDGSSTSTRMYVNTNGTTGWTAVTTAT